MTVRLASIGEERPLGKFRFKTNDDVGWTLFLGRQKEWPETWASLKVLDDVKVRINNNDEDKLPDQINVCVELRIPDHAHAEN